MKKIILLAVVMAFGVQLFATHYRQKGNTNELKSLYYVNDGLVKEKPAAKQKFYYEFYSDCSGLKDKDGGLTKTGLSKVVSESGRVHNIAHLFTTYERRAKGGGGDMDIKSQHDSDVICVLQKTGDDYTIDIYTGQDAKDFLAGKK